MKNETNAPPRALICGECFQNQRKAQLSGKDEFYCEHQHVWAIRRPDGGWLLSTNVSPEDHRALLEDARRLQSLDEIPAIESAVQSVH
ncbi:MAG: hypothetical protein OER80_10690 [Gammaproteobacteria bacterium]|nr:hypothetical protein [Gammaproteobacteria bacterium]MDH3768433.1 hypothetical protein [Gammaproteobacteria bacterium]